MALSGGWKGSRSSSRSRFGSRHGTGQPGERRRQPMSQLNRWCPVDTARIVFVQQGGFEHSGSDGDGDFPRLRTLRVGIHVSLGARHAVRSVGAALGMEPPRVKLGRTPVAVALQPRCQRQRHDACPGARHSRRGRPASTRTTRWFGWPGNSRDCHTGTVPTRRRTGFRSMVLARRHGCWRSG